MMAKMGHKEGKLTCQSVVTLCPPAAFEAQGRCVYQEQHVIKVELSATERCAQCI